jgi:hypothetical protein
MSGQMSEQDITVEADGRAESPTVLVSEGYATPTHPGRSGWTRRIINCFGNLIARGTESRQLRVRLPLDSDSDFEAPRRRWNSSLS